MMSGVNLIDVERTRQITREGFTAEHDDEHDESEMALAASCYIMESVQPGDGDGLWPWDDSWWKPSDDRVTNLVKAGALIAAEIDRLLRADAKFDSVEDDRRDFEGG